MPPTRLRSPEYAAVELDGVRYAILPERLLREVCRQAGVRPEPAHPAAEPGEIELDGPRLARRLVQRRKRAELTQAELARRAGVRVETLNRIERGRTTPDFSTVRKLVIAMNRAEAELRSVPNGLAPAKEPNYASPVHARRNRRKSVPTRG